MLFHIFSLVRITEWPPIGEQLLTQLTICFRGISTYMSFWFLSPPLGLWSGKFFLILVAIS